MCHVDAWLRVALIMCICNGGVLQILLAHNASVMLTLACASYSQYTLIDVQSLNRMVVKADLALVKVPELNFEIPPNTQRGVVTTIEGLLSRCISDLLKEQPVRKVNIEISHNLFMKFYPYVQAINPDLASQIDDFIDKLRGCLDCTNPFSIVSL